MSSYVYTTIHDPAAGSFGGTNAWGINNNGQIVGYSQTNPDFANGFLYSGGTYTTLTYPAPNNFETFAFGINDAGQIVGWSDTIHGFLYNGGSFTTLDHRSGTFSTTPIGINNSGQIV